MNVSPRIKPLLQAILSGGYTPPDVHEFVQLCYTLALPLIRKKIILGKLSFETLGMKEADVVYDCLADLFRRNEQNTFVKIESFFQGEGINLVTCFDEELVTALRRLVFLKVNNNIIRLYSESDPTLGKVLRNIKLAVQKEKLFDEVHRFGETYLLPRGSELFPCSQPWPSDVLEQRFSRVVLVHDTLLTMLTKLRNLLMGQNEFQRAVPLVPVALMVKKVYAIGWEGDQEIAPSVEGQLEQNDLIDGTERVCKAVEQRMYKSYVSSRKCSEDLFRTYIQTVREILLHSFLDPGHDGLTYFQILRKRMPELTKREYFAKHRKKVEYLAKTAKKEIQRELQRQ